jgi:DNA-binding NarL/FixJ family response regulator
MNPDRIVSVARETPGTGESLHPGDESMVLRVLCGEQQKVLALEDDVAISTLSTRYNRALRKLGITSQDVPTALVLAAQRAAGVVPSVSARGAAFEYQNDRYYAVSVRRPSTAHLGTLSLAERQVAAWVIEGCSRREVALRRASSKHTASRHIHSVFARLQVSGRYALIRRAAQLGCFPIAE